MRGFSFFCLTMFVFNQSQAAAVSVDTMIVIAVDVSNSITDEEYDIQKKGVINAFRDPGVQSLLNNCSLKGDLCTTTFKNAKKFSS